MNWKNYIIIVISFGIGLFIGWHPAFESVRKFMVDVVVPLGLTGGGLAMVFKLWDWVEEQNKDKKKTKLDYSRTLVDKNLIHRATMSKVGFDVQNDYDLQIKITGLLGTTEYNRYSNDVDFCLQEYKKIQEIVKKRDYFIEQHNIKLKSFLAKLNSDIVNNLRQNHPIFVELSHKEWAKNNQTPLNYFVKEHLFDIGLFVQGCYERDCIFYLDADQSESDRWGRGTLWKITLKVTIVAGIDKQEINDIRNMFIDSFYNAIKSPDFSQLKKCFVKINSLHKNYIEELDKLIIETVDKNKPLKGIKL